MNNLKVEIKDRIGILQNTLKQNDLDAYVITDQEDIWYFTNINYKPEQRPFLFVVYPDRRPLFIVPKLEVDHFTVPYFDYDLDNYFDVTSGNGKNWYDLVAKHLSKLVKVGVESNSQLLMTHFTDNIKWKVGFLVQNQRMIKSTYEIDKLQYVSKICSNVVNKTLSMTKTGTKVADTYQLAMKVGAEEIVKHFSLENRAINAVWPAEYSFMPHSIPDMNARVGAGPNIDIALFVLQGYAAECERTFFTETPTKENMLHFNQMMYARKLFLDKLKPGTKASDIEKVVDDYFEDEGVEKNILHRPGHGIGLNNHEWPTLSLGNDTVLKENMVVSVEPALYFKDQGGYRHSDTALITKNGYKLMTSAPTSISELVLK
ncbi:Xaa-Pro aminopeptidase [Lactiplantibacillus plantarum]|uniref:M24 family metallopeptidase n=1 Tax=Lactiplantibacillus plantarum TaxID=1590 RepID=UPI0004DD297C|nr:Xaa-Pro peptidase family protein [Lactiplantibacillus plantarum]KEZ12150.1 Xaa-Pro aminopeptidase [Lactiplantibacillus plantarum]